MPICFVPGREGDDGAGDKRPGLAQAHQAHAHQEWREPPGYLGEAVRRAKRIASRSRQDETPGSEDR